MTTEKCPTCGSPMEAGKPCPYCLLQLAAQSDSVPDSLPETLTEAEKSPRKTLDIAVVQKAFPQLEIIEQIGRGGMGTVFKARQPKLDRFVALKILSEQLAEKPTFAERFAQEGKLLARLSHPNIVAVYDFGQTETTDDAGNSLTFFFLILEYVDGVNLRQAMREERFTPDQALAIVPKICEALQYAHDEGVLHRDIKPENILLDTKGRVKIADFGIARFNDSTSRDLWSRNSVVTDHGSYEEQRLTQTGVVLGTPNYMAPEQLETPGTVDHRADIYSLGVVFYELLTGELPKGQLKPPSEKTPVNAEIDGIVLKALQRDRSQRHQSAEELKTEIETATVAHPKSDKSFMQFVKQQGLRFQIGIVGAIVAGISFFFISGLPTENYFLGFIAKIATVTFLTFFSVDIYLCYKKFLRQSTDELKTKIETPTLVHSKAGTPATKNDQKSRLSPGKAIGFGCLSIIVFVILSFVTVNVFFPRKQVAAMNSFFLSQGLPIPIEASPSHGMAVSPMTFIALISMVFFILLIVFLVRKAGGSQSSTSVTLKPDPSVKFCSHCGAEIGESATACLKCGYALRSKQNYCYHCGVQTDPEQVICVKCGVGFSKQMAGDFIGGPKQKIPVALFAILLGSFGVHKFYLESWGWGIVYLIFFWSGIPGIVGIIEGILYLMMDDSTFDMRYNQTKPGPFRW